MTIINPQNFDVFNILSDQGCALVSRQTFQVVSFNDAWSQMLNVPEGVLFEILPGLDRERMRRSIDRGGRFKADVILSSSKRGELGVRVETVAVDADHVFV